MNTKFKRIIAIVILIVMFLGGAPGNSYAATDDDTSTSTIIDKALGGLDGVVGILTIPPRVLVVILSAALQGLASILGHIDGSTDKTNNKSNTMITVEDIFFNRLNITSINFFDTNSPGSISNDFRTNVAIWYYVLRNLAIIILLCILIYVGIRMAISTVASEKAVYKTMFKDWLVSFILVFFIHYIIVVTIQVNNSIVSIMNPGTTSGIDFMDKLVMVALGVNPDKIEFSAVKAWGATIVYAMMVFFTMAFLWTYIKRMITLAFLIIISPLVTVTYAIDKMGDGKSQAFNTWLKEFVYNILLQPFQCVIYLALIKNSIQMIGDEEPSLGICLLVIMSMAFVYEAERIIRHIFGFKGASIKDPGASAVAMMATMNTLGKLGGKGRTPAAAKAAGKVAAKTTNAGLAQNKLANKNISKAISTAKNSIEEGKNKAKNAIEEGKNKAIKSSALLGKVASTASRVSSGINNVNSFISGGVNNVKESIKNAADKGTPIQKMAANAALAAGNELKNVGNGIKKDIKGAVSSVGNFTRSINTVHGAIQAGMTVMGVAAGLTTGDAAKAVTYGIAGNEIGSKLSAPAQDRYRDKQERRLSDNYKEIAKSYGELSGDMNKYDLTTEQGRENMKEKCKEITDKGPTRVQNEFEKCYENYQSSIENNIRSSNPSMTDREVKSQARSEIRQRYNDVLNGNSKDIKAEIDSLRSSGNTDQADKLAAFSKAVQDKELSDNLTRMMGIEAALGEKNAEKIVVTGENSTIDRINEGIRRENNKS